MSEIATVNTPSGAYQVMLPRWRLACALLGGTEAMRAAGKDFLPQYERETDEAYRIRLGRSTLLNYFGKTVKTLAERPFAEPVKLGQNFPAQLAAIEDDVDGLGHDLTAFLRAVFKDAIAKGFSHIFVDFPAVDPEQVKTVADEQARKLRPYFVHIPAESLIASYAETVDGKEVLAHVRWRECEVVREGFGERTIERVRIWERDHWELWEGKQQGGGLVKYEPVANGPNTLGFIPLATFYAGHRDGLMIAKPPLQDLADKNVEHWQSSSDQRNVLGVARFPILTATGIDQNDGAQIALGPKRLLAAKSPDARFAYLEHQGHAISAGRQDLEDIKDEMAMLGVELLVRRQGAPTATEKAINTEQGNCELQSMANDCADTVELAFSFAAKWLKLEVGDEQLEVEIEADVGVDESSTQDLDALNKARAAREISRAAFLAELKRRGVLMADFDAEADAERLAEEGPSLGALRLPQPPMPGTPPTPGTQPPTPKA